MFLDAPWTGTQKPYSPQAIAAAIRNAAAEASRRAEGQVTLTVLGAGMGSVAGRAFSDPDDWTDARRAQVENEIRLWVEQVRDAMKPDLGAVAVGVDGHVEFAAWSPESSAVQVVATFEGNEAPHLTWKSIPVGDEYEALSIAWNALGQRPGNRSGVGLSA